MPADQRPPPTPTQRPGDALSLWFQTPAGRYLLDWERQQFDAAVANVFGYHALQLGLPELDTLAANRMPHRWLALPESDALPGPTAEHPSAPKPEHRRLGLVTHLAALPFAENSLDLLVLPHTLELSADPHAVLREVERVLVPEGRVVITGLNPRSLWGLRQARARLWSAVSGHTHGLGQAYVPEAGAFISHRRLRDWLHLLGLEVDQTHLGAYRPAVHSNVWLQRWAWMDSTGARWWPGLGAVYFLVAIKRVRGMHLLGPAWKPRRRTAAAAMPIARSDAAQSSYHHQK